MDNDFGRRRGDGSHTTGLANNTNGATSASGMANGHSALAGSGTLGVEAIVLDIDDTLYLERDYVRSGFEAVGRWAQRELGIEDFGARAWAAFESGARNTIFDDVLTECSARADDAVITELVARYRTHVPSIALATDAREGLERWHDQVPLAAVTDGHLSSQ